MKYLLPILLIFSFVLCEEYEDVVYLKNGSVIRGMIIEEKPNKYIKIQSGKNIFVYQIDEIEKITKEINTKSSNGAFSNIHNNTFSLSGGLLTAKNINVVQLTKDFKISKNWAFFIGTGYPWVFSLGLTGQSNYNNNGLIFGWSGASSVAGDAWGTMSLGYQWRINNSPLFFILGAGIYSVEYYDYYYGNVSETMPYSVISIDMRF